MTNIKEKLKELTKRSNEGVAIIEEILNSHLVIGRHNKEKIIVENAQYDSIELTKDKEFLYGAN